MSTERGLTLDPFAGVSLPTPLVALSSGGGALYGKAEFVLPSGSAKHRAIPPHLFSLQRAGVIATGQPVVIHSAGSAALAAAWAGARAGLPVHALVPRNCAEGVLATLRWLGAHCHAVASKDAASLVASLTREGAYFLDQFADAALSAYYGPIADELLAQCPELEAVVVGIGTGSAIAGIARRLRVRGANCRVVGVEPEEAQLSLGRPWAPHDIAGLAPPSTLGRPLYDAALVDEVIPVASATAWQIARRLAREEGLMVGPAAGATVAAAERLVARGARRVVAILGGRSAEVVSLARVQQLDSELPEYL